MPLVIFSNNLVEYQENDYGQTNKPILRKNNILQYLEKMGSIINCNDDFISKNILLDVHDATYIDFLKNCYDSFLQSGDVSWTGFNNDLVPCNFYKRKPHTGIPLYKLTGFYGSDIMTPISANTWQNSRISAIQAIMAALHLYNHPEDIVYALTTSPGHHAKYAEYGGYCFINNAVLAARSLVDNNAEAIAILDLDYHAGNGTNDIINSDEVWWTKNIFAYSIHCDPTYDYPSFEGFDDEYNYTLPPHSNWSQYEIVLEKVCQQLTEKKIAYLIIAFGGDTYKDDPDAISIGKFDLDIPSYHSMAKTIRKYFPKIPIMITQEGGYNMAHIGEIVSTFISGLIPTN